MQNFRPHTFFRVALFAAMLPAVASAELELRSVAEKADAMTTKRKFGPYVGIYAGESMGQSGKVSIQGRSFPMNDSGGSAIFGVEIGRSWRLKRVPLMLSARFEGTFSQTSMFGSIGNLPGVTNDVVSYTTDMNSLMFTLGGSMSLDLWRYRARIGKVLAGFKPYIGAGFGGGQVWFRNSVARSDSQANHGGNLTPAANPFSVDEFINAWHWYSGLEWSWQDKYSVFAEYRDFTLGDTDDLKSFNSNGYVLGFRYRY
jgi:opacity protein-like surface antigen